MADDPSDRESTPGEVAIARETLLRKLVSFARGLRARGAEVPADATLLAAQSLATVGLADRERVRAALRAALVSRHEDLAVFEEQFPVFWRSLTVEDPGIVGGVDPELRTPSLEETTTAETPGESAPTDDDGVEVLSRLEVTDGDETLDAAGTEQDTAVYSPTGSPEPVEADAGLRHTDEALAGPVQALTDALAQLRGRRWTAGGDARPDVRRALRRSVETGGTVLDLPGRERRESAVRAVLLVDVSRSVLDTVDRGFLVSFVRAVSEAWRDVTVFFFDTSVRDVSDAFDRPAAAGALSALEEAEAAWGGGTRIGHAIGSVRQERPTVVDRETVVVVISDGLEVGEIDVLEREMAWLSRQAATVLWANPLAGAEAYEPSCRGMAAALPYVDGLFAFAGPEDVSEMARQLSRHGPGDNVGYQFDPRRRPARKR